MEFLIGFCEKNHVPNYVTLCFCTTLFCWKLIFQCFNNNLDIQSHDNLFKAALLHLCERR